MAHNLRKLGIIFAVAVLFSIFVFSFADALVPSHTYPETCIEATEENYDDYRYLAPKIEGDACPELREATQAEINACQGTLNPDRREGCPTDYVCSCWEITQEFDAQDDSVRFWIAIVLGFIAVIAGMMLPAKQELNEWVGAGFMLGGLITIFLATAMFWQHIDKVARPIVIALELGLVLWVAYRKFGSKKK